jgi:integrase
MPKHLPSATVSLASEGKEKEEAMTLYRRGRIWWYQFEFQGALIRESSGLTNKEAARAVEDNRKADLRNGRQGIAKPKRVPMFGIAADLWLKAKRADWAPKTSVIERTNVAHLAPTFGKRLLSDIDANDVCIYKADRLEAGASPKTISLELGTLRALMRRNNLDSTWCAIAKQVKLDRAEKKGRVISTDEETALLSECQNSRSRSLYVAVVIALQACLRYSEIRQLLWQQIDLGRRTITVGKSKTDKGEGRVIPMSRFLYETLALWAAQFPDRKLNHFVFPKEKYGQPKKGKPAAIYAIDVTRPIGTWKYGWHDARKRAGVTCRFHDLRHTGCTRLLDAGVPHPVVAEIMGWSTSTAIRMIKEVYGHISLETRKRAIEQVESFMGPARYAQFPTHSKEMENGTIQ